MGPTDTARREVHDYRLLFEENPQAMWVFDRTSLDVIEANRAAAVYFGYSCGELCALRAIDLLVPGEHGRFLTAARESAQAVAGAWCYQTKSGLAAHGEISAQAIQYRGRPAVLCVLADATGRRQLEEQFRQSQKMEAVGLLAGGVAHDFNNLLTIIAGYGQILLGSLGERDDSRQAVEQIMKAGESAAALTRQLLAFSRRQAAQPRLVELDKLVGGMRSMLRRLIGEDIELRFVLEAGAGHLFADPGQIEQVIMNLVVNARDAMPRGGTLTIGTAGVVLDAQYVSRHLSVRPGEYLLLSVTDTGVGMDEATRAHLFEPFFTTKAAGRGTGLGLSTVFGIVKQGGGSVDVYSEPGRGTSVKVYLPRAGQPAATESEAPARPAPRGTETILVVEDEAMVRRIVCDTLARAGYRIIEAAGPADAGRAASAFEGPIHLMLTDVVMPKQSGLELAEELRRSRPEMKVLFVSGYADSAVTHGGMLGKDTAFLQKPFSPAALERKVREVLDRNGLTRGAGK